MKLNEITDVGFDTEQLDEGIKQQLAATIVAALMAFNAHGSDLGSELAKSMTPEEKAALPKVINRTEVRMDFQDWLKKEASKVAPKDSKVQSQVVDKVAMKKVTDELLDLIKDDDKLLNAVK